MNSLFVISIVSWIGMWFAFHLGHPVGYVISLIGLAATAAIALDTPSSQAETEGREASGAVLPFKRRQRPSRKPSFANSGSGYA